MISIYHPVEAACLRLAFGLPAEEGDAALDLWDDTGALPLTVLHLQPDGAGDRDVDRAASNLVARLVLGGIQSRLPDGAVVARDGRVTRTRKPIGRRKAAIAPLPMLLFAINWADTAPGLSWPEAYHLGFLPVFDRWVLLVSRDSTDIDGYCDGLLAHFGPLADPVAAVVAWLEADWRMQSHSYDQQRWAYILEAGRLSEGEVEALADRVWGGAADGSTDDVEAPGTAYPS